jgi:cysteine desulfurase
MIYLDHAATTAMYPEAVEKMLPYLQKQFFNPSGACEEGVKIHRELEKTREILAKSIHAAPEEIIFTSGGTESDNWVLRNAAENVSSGGRHIITSAIEHHAVLNTCKFLETRGFTVTYLPVNKKGIVEPNVLQKAIGKDTIFISVMYANNEIGTVQPIAELSAIAGEHHIPFHTDAVQAYGHLPIDVKAENIDFLSVSAHKFGGPKGIGFLYAGKGRKLTPYLHGGAQEQRRRAGTENVAGIVGMGAAADISVERMEKNNKKITRLREYLMHRILSEIEQVRLNGSSNNRLPGNLNLSFRNVSGQSLIALLELKGICVSAGSACTSSEKGPSHVLKAIGLSDEMAEGAVRITIGEENTMEEMAYVFETIRDAVEELRQVQ